MSFLIDFCKRYISYILTKDDILDNQNVQPTVSTCMIESSWLTENYNAQFHGQENTKNNTRGFHSFKHW